MAKKLIAVQGMVLEITPKGVNAQLTILTPPERLYKAHVGPLDIMVINLSHQDKGTAVPGMAKVVIQPSATKCFFNGKAAIREGDKIDGSDNGTAMKPGPNGAPVPSPINFTITVKKAGQDKLLSV